MLAIALSSEVDTGSRDVAIRLEHRTMQLIRLTHSLAAAVLVALLTATSALAQDISVRHPWSRATPKGAQVAGAYLMIENGGMMPDKLLEASTPAARKIEIHRMSVADGVMTMRPVEGG